MATAFCIDKSLHPSKDSQRFRRLLSQAELMPSHPLEDSTASGFGHGGYNASGWATGAQPGTNMRLSRGTETCYLLEMLVVIFGLCACGHFKPPSEEMRARSFVSSLPDGEADGMSVYARQRTAVFLTAGFTAGAVRAVPEGIAINFTGEATAPWVLPTLAVAIEPDGYFLTAAHVVVGTNVYLAYRTEEGGRLARPRIVARRLNPMDGSDYAVLHVDDHLRHVFDWASPVRVRAGLQVLAVGLSELTPEGWLSLTCMGGRIRWVSDPDSPLTIHSDLPVRWGDSGGPMIDASGRLLGVNLSVRGGWWRPTRTVSAMPDHDTITRILREDRAYRHESHTPFQSTSDPMDRPDLMISL